VTGVDDVLVTIGRVIGKPPGWERVVRAVAPPRRFAHLGLRHQRTPEGYLFPLDRGTLLGWYIHFFGSYEPEVRDQFRRWLRPGDVAIDVGANVGWHTLLMANLVGTEGRVYAFEPNETTRARLLAAIDMNGLTQVVVDPRAASDGPGAVGFQAPVAGDVWDGTGRLVGDRTSGNARVDCVTLDTFAADRGLDRLALVKIDVEGWELSVLRGARLVLETLRPVLLFEYDPMYVSRCGGSGADLSACLADRGYVVFALNPRRRPKRVTGIDGAGGNFLAVPREAAER